ncbi:LEA domain protein [Fusarium beomiforme]|uniref:LEA domain protein n=1 Tax=Fusarium beomiforme TaxID=44412 RepID=A0A9P5A6W4_9HYPO|nr:LEA domain protein [Fusarium beomiforme]
MSETKESTAINEGQFEDANKGTTSREQRNPVNLESVPRGIAGGTVPNIDSLDYLADNDVNSAGDVVRPPCDISGKTLQLGQEKPYKEKQEEQQDEHSSHDEEYSEYTTQGTEKNSGGLNFSGPKDNVDRLTSAVSNTSKTPVSTVAGALGLGDKSGETTEASEQTGEAMGQTPEAKTQDQKDTSISFEDSNMSRVDKEVVETEGKLKEFIEEAKRKEKVKKDELASALAYNIDETKDKIRPICKMIDDKISYSDVQSGEESSEEQLVRQVRPLIEEGAKILIDNNRAIRGLDPDGCIQRNAKQQAALTGIVTSTINNAKRKLESMPHAKKEVNPLWALLAAPLFQIIAGVELLLDGMLVMVGKLLFEDVISSLTGKKKK